ncbi:MAG: hypothetical protein R2757_14885 [Draconibacterium sp.]
MKTTKIKLLAMMITLAAVTTIANPVNAQRRTTSEKSIETKRESQEKSKKSSVQNKNLTQNHDNRQPSKEKPKVDRSREVKRYTPSSAENRNKNASSQRNENKSSNSENHSKPAKSNNEYRKTTEPQKNQSNQYSKKPATTDYSDKRRETSVRQAPSRKENRVETNSRRNESESYSNRGTHPNENKDRRPYTRIDESDKRYSPTREYRGSNNYWSGNDRPSDMNYNRNDRNFNRNYNYNKYNHWDRRWENYRWNVTSWRDYYWGYNPYSFKYSRYYYHHHRYGHVVRKFIYPPVVFVHNHHNYYCYDGHFFRYHRGVGYVLVDIPFGFTFDYLPGDYDRVYINGYPYFRIGNLFFESSDFGFRLIHYPERYIAINVELELNEYY